MTSRISLITKGLEVSTSQESELARVLDKYLAALEAGETVDPEMLSTGVPEPFLT
jgi:hypothetical protein